MHLVKQKSIASIFFILLCSYAQAQPVFVKLIYRPGKIPTELTGITDTHLLTKDKAFEIEDVLSLVFREQAPDSVTFTKIRKAGIPMYIKNKRYKGIEDEESSESFNSTASIGFGAGLDYGGFGAKFSLFPAKPIGLFAGLGSNIVDVGYNVGIDWKFYSKKRSTGFLALMYGYHAASDYGSDKVFYGLSAQAGARIKANQVGKNYFSTSIILPFRNSEFKEYEKINERNVRFLPVALTIGFHFGL
jgi:hypothetical protein